MQDMCEVKERLNEEIDELNRKNRRTPDMQEKFKINFWTRDEPHLIDDGSD